jgi:hypothetical protein
LQNIIVLHFASLLLVILMNKKNLNNLIHHFLFLFIELDVPIKGFRFSMIQAQ